MGSSEIFQQQSCVSLKLAVHALELVELCKEYLSQFGNEDFFSFSDIERRNKAYKKGYYDFTAKLPEVCAAMELAICELSDLILRADREIDLPLTELLGRKLEAYRAFEASLSEFSKDTVALISAPRISPSLLCASVRKLMSAAERLCESFNKES